MRNGLLVLFAVLAFAGIVIAFKTASPRSRPKSVPASSETVQPVSDAALSVPLETKTRSDPVAQSKESVRSIQPLTNAPLSLEQRLVAEMLEICSGRGPITAEQAEKFKKDLEQLIHGGAASANAIREFLAKNTDTPFAEIAGGDQLGFSSMRSALIDALKQIGGPEAQAAMLQTLQTSAVPAELLELAKDLDTQAPGIYREQILRAAREALEMAAANQLATNAEIGPAYRILSNFGEAGTAESTPDRDPATFYNAVSMANLPDGQGLPALLKMAQDSNPEAAGKILATEMIAQLAGQNSSALDALTEMAQKDQISNRVWTRLAPILAGDQYQVSSDPQSSSADARVYSVVNTANSADVITQRIGLIDHFLSMVQPDSSAAFALQQQRNVLASRLSN